MWWMLLWEDFKNRYNPKDFTRETLATIQAANPDRRVYAELRTILYYRKIGL